MYECISNDLLSRFEKKSIITGMCKKKKKKKRKKPRGAYVVSPLVKVCDYSLI